jgi:two-component system, OmpR family, response regulator
MPDERAEEWGHPHDKLILVVDDDLGMRELLEHICTSEGFRFAAAASGREGLTLAAKTPPDLLLLDLMMPDMGGYEVVRELQTGEAAGAKVLVMTARNVDGGTRDMFKREPNVLDFIMKPLPAMTFGVRLHQALKTRPQAQGVPG